MQIFFHSDAPLTEKTELDRDHPEANADIVMRIAEPDTLEDIVALSAQSDTPIVFGNTILHPDFCICNIPVKSLMTQARSALSAQLGCACFDLVSAAVSDVAAASDDVHQRLVEFLTPPQSVDQAPVIGFWKMYNTFYDSLRIPVEPHLLSETEYVNA